MLDYLLPWIKQRPTVRSIIIGLVLVAVGQLFDQLVTRFEILQPLKDFTDYLYNSLSAFDVTRVGAIFYRELTGCELVWNGIVCAPGPDSTDTLLMTMEGQSQPGMIMTLISAIINTVTEVFSNSTWLGIVIYILAIVASFAIIRAIFGDFGGFYGLLVVVAIVPAIATVVMLAMKAVLLLVTAIFGEVLGGLMTVSGYLGGVFKWLSMGHQVLSHAHQLDSAGSIDVTKSPPPPTGKT